MKVAIKWYARFWLWSHGYCPHGVNYATSIRHCRDCRHAHWDKVTAQMSKAEAQSRKRRQKKERMSWIANV